LTQDYKAPPIPVHKIAEEQGVDVVFADFGKHAETVAGFCDFAGARLFVNRVEPTSRQTFTIAHELGHWILHRAYFEANPERYPVLPRKTHPNKADPFEKEANCFAANLLVPERLLIEVKHLPTDMLASLFGVSPTMMSYRR
jgi:Zn-dependent peptidase ImmA (M78 family)